MGLSRHAVNLPRSLGFLSALISYRKRVVHLLYIQAQAGNENLSHVRTTPTVRTPPHLLYWRGQAAIHPRHLLYHTPSLSHKHIAPDNHTRAHNGSPL